MTVMRVPKAAIHENHRAPARQYDIRFSRQAYRVKCVTKAPAMQSVPDDYLRARICATDASHHAAADFRGYDINHAQ